MAKIQIEVLSAYPYKITLIKSRDGKTRWKNSVFKKNEIQIFFINKNNIYISGKVYDETFKGSMKDWKPLSALVKHLTCIINERSGKKRKLQLYDFLVDILEALGYTPPLAELNYELIHNHAHWIEAARNYYFSAKILERNYNDVMQRDGNKKRKSRKLSKRFEETFYTDRVIIYLYGRVLECILKSRIYYKLENIYDYLTEHKRIDDKRLVKRWAEKHLYTHNLFELARMAGCMPRKKSEKNDYGQITALLMDGKYPGPKKDALYGGIANGQLEADIRAKVNKTSQVAPGFTGSLLSGKAMFNYFDQLTLCAVERCYGANFCKHFSEWHRPKIVRRMTAWAISYSREVRERNELIKMIRTRAGYTK